MKVSIVVLNFNNYGDTKECLCSLGELSHEPHEIIVVDNGSNDGSLERLRRDFPSLTYIENSANLGYAGGNNIGILHALQHGADAVWILNNDTVAHREALAKLVEAATKFQNAGLLGSLNVDYYSRDRVNFAGGKIIKRTGSGRHIEKSLEEVSTLREPFKTDFVTGASMFARREMIIDTGLMDERYFLYLEDVDWALRARRTGWEVYLVPDSIIWHKITGTSGQNRPHIIYYACRNSLYLSRKHFLPFLPLVFCWCIYAYVLAYLARFVIEGFDRGRLPYLYAGYRGITDFLRGRAGEYQP